MRAGATRASMPLYAGFNSQGLRHGNEETLELLDAVEELTAQHTQQIGANTHP